MTWTNWIGGALVGAVVAFVAGYLMRDRVGARRAQSAERRARDVIDQAGREAESRQARRACSRAAKRRCGSSSRSSARARPSRNEQLATERAFQEKEAAFNRRVELIEKKDRDLKRSEQELATREAAVARARRRARAADGASSARGSSASPA